MSELLPTVQARRVQESLQDYLKTTFALTDADASDGLDRFLADRETGIFRGPYVRTRLPFLAAAEGWRRSLAWDPELIPYGHQAAAFARLASAVDGVARRPQSTLVTTGTGSGKTEAFLYPMIDHVLRARQAGITGTKALILYPMNALANDQAQRLTGLLTTRPELSAITAALYVGQDGPPRTKVTAEGLITDRGIIRDIAPDILLTNYKMLDQLLLRADDREIWRQSATSLQYLILDEFHTYDGAQGTDVAMLLRRLGLVLKGHWSPDDPRVTDEDRARPLGRMTPVATSATLGDKGDPAAMLDFAATVFGDEFTDEAVITESRIGLAEWVGDAAATVDAAGLAPVDASLIDVVGVNAAVDALPDGDGAALATAVLAELYEDPDAVLGSAGPELLLAATRAHPLVQAVARESADAIDVDVLAARIGGPAAVAAMGSTDETPWTRFLRHVVAMLGHVRTIAGRDGLSVELHLWIRELTRMDRAADTTAEFRWSDDGPPSAATDADDLRPSFPAVYCRHCGRSGWGVTLTPVGTNLAVHDEAIRREHASGEGRFRALLYAPGESERGEADGAGTVDGLVWFSVRGRALLGDRPSDDDPDLRDGWTLPVLTTVGKDADKGGKADTCPACGQEDGIRFLGSAIATLLSVSVSTLFGAPRLDSREKKALIFTDSVQDAAHRAGFIQARSHTLTLRAALREAVEDGALSLEELAKELVSRAGDDPFARYRILAPDCADRDSFREFWQKPRLRGVSPTVRTRVGRRLLFDAAMEFGLNSRIGRTLELTGSVAAQVDAGPRSRVVAVAGAAMEGYTFPVALDGSAGEPNEATLVAWVSGVLDRLRSQGAIDHPWFDRYRAEDGNRWSVTGGRPRDQGMPAFPFGRPAPAYARVGGSLKKGQESGLDPVTSAQSWYSRWTARVLDVSTADAGTLVRLLLDRLARADVLVETTSKTGATVYAIPPSRITLVPVAAEDLAAGRNQLACALCHAVTPGTTRVVDELAGAPCLVVRCRGRLARSPLPDGFYRDLYSSPDMRRVVAREHTSLLEDATRLAYENGFKGAHTDPQSPNVLVATPTLEMGIDIGDLSAVFLASLPRTVASYVQRVGRAGRLTGNAMNLAFVTGRGDQLPQLGNPLSVINGEVRPPATYLEAEEILRRQYTAYLVDTMARDGARTQPRCARGAIGSSEPGSFLGRLIELAESGEEEVSGRFLASFGEELDEAIAQRLRHWVHPGEAPGTSPFAQRLHGASRRWQLSIETLKHRLDEIDALLPALQQKAESPAKTDDDTRAYRSARAAHKLTSGQRAHLTGEYWIGVLEEYGILPNYTLLDDAVVLDVGLSWVDPDSGTFKSEHAQIQRGSAQAIREFAPGATFYARGYEIRIDAIDLGMDGEAIRPWAFCPACGFAGDVELDGHAEPLSTCPRCGSSGIADTGQQVDVVELTHVSAELRRDEVMINDRRDQRDSGFFQLFTAVDVDPAGMGSRWFVEANGLGCTYLNAVDVRWINAGAPGHGATRTISGIEKPAALFRVCAGCGKLDTDAGRNLPHEHRPWCVYREAATENTRSVALSRTLRTQGLLLRLPASITIGDRFALPSLSAALMLGLRELVGGHPDHIRVERVIDPMLTDGTDNDDALLLHDIVPGGTGYLAELATPARLRQLLVLAWDRVRTCECQHEDRLACHACLLPFVHGPVGNVSRATAERHLRALLGLSATAETAAESAWTTTVVPPTSDPESHLEQRFRQVLGRRLEAIGAAVTEIPGAWGNTVRFTLPDATRQWTLAPQVNLENSKPDFVLQSNDTTVPAVAIFVDGRAFHAVPAHNRLKDDAEKRAILRDTGKVVIAVTARDLQDAENGGSPAPSWYDLEMVSQLISLPQFMTSPTAYAGLQQGPIDSLIDWVSGPAPDAKRQVARAVPMFFGRAAESVSVAPDVTLAAIGAARLRGLALPAGNRSVQVWKSGSLAVAFAPAGAVVDAAVVLDDRDGSIGDQGADDWREWLRIFNHLALRDWPTTTTTIRAVAAGIYSVPPLPTPAARPPAPDLSPDVWPEPWQSAYQLAKPGEERELVAALAAGQQIEAPAIGHDGPDGIPLDLSWPRQRVAVRLAAMSEQDRTDVLAVGWVVVDPTVEAVVSAVLSASRPADQTGGAR